MLLSPEVKNKVLEAQRNEITGHLIYKILSLMADGENNKKLLERLSADELAHYYIWKQFTEKDVKPYRFKILFYTFVTKFMGLNFSVRLMELGERMDQGTYSELKIIDPRIDDIIKTEEQHEEQMLSLLDKPELEHAGSIVLGLNDALVELTGALAGLTLALQSTKIIGIAGLITGIAAALSMAGSNYLATKEEGIKNPLKASFYTGASYIIAVFFLILPYFIFKNHLVSLGITIVIALFIIFFFTFYISVAKNLSFKKRFLEMAGISLAVAFLSFFLGFLIREFLGVNI